MTELRIATRQSPLALWQTEHVAERLRALDPDLKVTLVPMTTRGDQVLDRPLADIGGKGLFLKELEVAMLEGRADLAVHSCKDMPAEMESPFVIAALLERADHSDALVSPRFDSLAALPPGARVGTSSLRRRVQLLAQRPDLQVRDLRGNVGTRLRKLDDGEYEAIILASAGLIRLGLEQRIAARLSPPEFLPAAAQGVIAIECREDAAELRQLLGRLHHLPSAQVAGAERAFTRALGGSCDVPIAAYAEEFGEGRLCLHGLVASIDGIRQLRDQLSGEMAAAEQIGQALADQMIAQGAREILARPASQ